MKKLIIIVIFVYSLSGVSQNNPNQQIEKFFKTYTTKSVNEAIDLLYLENPWKSNIADAIANIKEKLTGLNSRLGTYYGEVQIGEKNLKDTFTVIHYLVKYERQPLRFEFKYYKPADDWVIYGFSYDDGISEELSQSLNIQFMEMDESINELKEVLK